jgi:dipeptidyl aminopeptidase/acylaminoacyl peptidase
MKYKEEKGISEKIFVTINGLAQGMFIKGHNKNNPIILFLHGGPGMPEYPLTQNFKKKCVSLRKYSATIK